MPQQRSRPCVITALRSAKMSARVEKVIILLKRTRLIEEVLDLLIVLIFQSTSLLY